MRSISWRAIKTSPTRWQKRAPQPTPQGGAATWHPRKRDTTDLRHDRTRRRSHVVGLTLVMLANVQQVTIEPLIQTIVAASASQSFTSLFAAIPGLF